MTINSSVINTNKINDSLSSGTDFPIQTIIKFKQNVANYSAAQTIIKFRQDVSHQSLFNTNTIIIFRQVVNYKSSAKTIIKLRQRVYNV